MSELMYPKMAQPAHYEKWQPPKTAKDWNSFLLEKYGYGIWPFVYSFLGLLFINIPDYFKIMGDIQSLRTEKLKAADMYDTLTFRLEKLKDLERHVIKVLARDKKDEKSIPGSYGLETFFRQSTIERAVLVRLRSISRPPFYGRGRPIKFVCQVAFVWSEIMRDRKGRRWTYILAFFNWLCERMRTLNFAQKYLSLPVGFGEPCLKRDFAIYRAAKNVKRKQKERLKILQELRSFYFPTENNDRHFGIEFTNKDICFDMSRENGVLNFPDGTHFLENSNTRHKKVK